MTSGASMYKYNKIMNKGKWSMNVHEVQPNTRGQNKRLTYNHTSRQLSRHFAAKLVSLARCNTMQS